MIRDLHLVARIGESWIALHAANIEAVVRVEEAASVPRAPESIMGLVAIRSRIITCVNAATIVGEVMEDAPFMAILSIDGHGYGIALNEVDDVTRLGERLPIPAALPEKWAALDPQVADFDGQPLFVLDPVRIVMAASGPLREAA